MFVAEDPSVPLVPNFARGEEGKGVNGFLIWCRRAGQKKPSIMKRERLPL